MQKKNKIINNISAKMRVQVCFKKMFSDNIKLVPVVFSSPEVFSSVEKQTCLFNSELFFLEHKQS